MKASDTRRLRAALLTGDCAAALAILDASPPASKGKSGTPPKPMQQKAATTAKVRAPRVLLAVAPCRCTLYEDGAILCREHEAARDCSAALTLIDAHKIRLVDYGKRMGFCNVFPTEPRVLIYQYAARWKDCPVKA